MIELILDHIKKPEKDYYLKKNVKSNQLNIYILTNMKSRF